MATIIPRAAGIYRIRVDRGDKPPKFYIGQAVILRYRFKAHLRSLRRGTHDNPPLQRAFIKYGESAFSFEVLLICERRKEVLSFYEQMIVDSAEVASIYNIRLQCVDSPLGRSLTPETCTKISVAVTGKKRSPEFCAMRSELTKKQMSDPIMLACISETTKRQMADPLQRLRISRTLTGREPSAEAMENMRIAGLARRGRKKPVEEIERRKATWKANYKWRPGRKLSVEEISRRQATRAANRAAQGLEIY